MTSLPSPLTRALARKDRSESDLRADLATRRPLVPTAVLGGAVAALAPLLVALAVGVVGWFLTDAGADGTPRGALRVGAFGWLMAHGSGVDVQGARITAIPLGVTLLVAWAIWRVGHRVGESISGHGPDAQRIADGARDLTVPLVGLLFTVGYVVSAVLVCTISSTASSALDTPRVVGFSIVLCALAGVPAIARGSGRAAVWVGGVPLGVRVVGRLVRTLLTWWLVLSALLLAIAFVVDFATAANITSQMHVDTFGDFVVLLLVVASVLPNAVLFSSSYLLGPGFSVGGGTAVSLTSVTLGPLPLFPLLAALPDTGPTPLWVRWLMAAPVLVAFVASARVHRLHPAASWDQAAIRGCAGGLLAGLALGLVSVFAGGAVGPGRMRDVGPDAFGVLLSAMAAFGIAALLGAVAMWWWQDRGSAQVGGLWARRPFRG
ncbi:cell division protein PerM [Nocardioides ultimimeridianus]